jgi:hypothetical protein
MTLKCFSKFQTHTIRHFLWLLIVGYFELLSKVIADVFRLCFVLIKSISYDDFAIVFIYIFRPVNKCINTFDD